MSSIDYDRYDDRRHRPHRHREDREPRYVETQETYIRSPAPMVPEPSYNTRTTEIIRRPTREDSDLSIEEVRRDFPPPGYAQPRSDRYGSSYQSRSTDRGYGPDPRRSYNDFDDRRSRKGQFYAEEEVVKPRRRSLSRNQKIIAGVAGAALAVGGKELWDRKQAEGRPVARNPLETAAIGAAGAFAGYEGAELYAKHGPGNEKTKVKTYVATRGRDGEVAEYYASDEESVRPKRSKSRRKSLVEGALGLAGIGAGAKALSGRDRDRDDRRSRRGSRSSSRGRGGSEGVAKFQQAAKAALLAGATEAFRVRKEPGGWGGDKGKRILTAAIGAGGIDAAADRDPDKNSKSHILQAVVGGLAGNRLINGSRRELDDDGRSIRSGRSRSRSRGAGGSGQGAGLAALATAGLGALAGKKLLDRSRSRSRGHGRDTRSRRYSSDYSRSPSPRRGEGRDKHKRSKSVTDFARKGLAALGLGGAAGAAAGSHDRDREVIEETTVRKSRRGGSDDGYSRRSRHGNSSRDLAYEPSSRGDVYGDPRYADSRSTVGRSTRNRDRGNDRRGEGRDSHSDSESSLGSSTDDEKKIKKMRARPRH